MKLIKFLMTLAVFAGVLAYGISEDTYCIYYSESRVACEDHSGFCSPLAWNYKIYYTKYYRCCYDAQGSYVRTEESTEVGPTPPVNGDCCQDLTTVGFDDLMWAMSCPNSYGPPSPP